MTTKLWGGRGYEDTLRSIDSSIRALDVGAIDLLLIHEPTGNFNEIYRAMETEYRAGKLRAIGVSNFLETNFERLIRTAEIAPAVDQLETHVFRQQRGMRSVLAKYGVAHEAWSPLAAGQNGFFTNPILKSIADAHGKSTAQTAEEMDQLGALDEGRSLFNWW
ncbi:MAG: aldo/keto reductase [Selenomonadaceae bacterium]|nr:aldo/keto reductase [Selenomonadaceae bacterium]